MPQGSEKETVNDQLEPVKRKVEGNMEGAVEHAQQEVARSRVPWYRAMKRTQILAVTCTILFVLFGLLAWFVYLNPVIPLDVKITREFQENKAPWLQALMIFISLQGNSTLISTLLVLVAAVAFWVVGLRLEAVYIVVLSGVSAVLNFSLKWLINRPRPTASLVEVFQTVRGKSFPSGHVMSYVAFWGLLLVLGFILFKRDRWWHYALLIVPAFFVVLVGPSRVYLGDHWASDVIGAYIMGGLLIAGSLWIYLALKKRGVLSR